MPRQIHTGKYINIEKPQDLKRDMINKNYILDKLNVVPIYQSVNNLLLDEPNFIFTSECNMVREAMVNSIDYHTRHDTVWSVGYQNKVITRYIRTLVRRNGAQYFSIEPDNIAFIATWCYCCDRNKFASKDVKRLRDVLLLSPEINSLYSMIKL